MAAREEEHKPGRTAALAAALQKASDGAVCPESCSRDQSCCNTKAGCFRATFPAWQQQWQFSEPVFKPLAAQVVNDKGKFTSCFVQLQPLSCAGCQEGASSEPEPRRGRAGCLKGRCSAPTWGAQHPGWAPDSGLHSQPSPNAALKAPQAKLLPFLLLVQKFLPLSASELGSPGLPSGRPSVNYHSSSCPEHLAFVQQPRHFCSTLIQTSWKQFP